MRLMRIKMICVMFLFASGVFLSTPQKADAEILWATVSVVRLNQFDTTLRFVADEVDGLFSNKTLWIDNNHPKQKEFLAIILTSISIDQNLRIKINSNTNEVTAIGTFPNN